MGNSAKAALGIGLVVSTDGKWLSDGVEDPLVQRQHIRPGEGQVEQLERAAQQFRRLVVHFVSRVYVFEHSESF